MSRQLIAGAASADISPTESAFLFGYPFVKRYSTGIHDPLLASALYLSDGKSSALFIACDICVVTRQVTTHIRDAISKQTGIAPGNILLSATHTHSGPIVGDYLSNEADPVVPKADPKYASFMEQRIIQAGAAAFRAAQPAKVGLAIVDATGIGTNRHDPAGPSDLRVPVLMVKSADANRNIAAMLVCNMHPTVLHEDSTLVSGDFPGLTRRYLQQPRALGPDCVIVYHMGVAGDQSPRHVTRANTFAEADRLGQILGRGVEKAVGQIQYRFDAPIAVRQTGVDLPLRQFPTVDQATKERDEIQRRLETLRTNGSPRTQVRTAECDWFGAEETLTLSRAAADGRLARIAQSVLPAEVQVIRIGPWTFAAWPGEVFIEFGLQVMRKHPDTFIITLANGELQGYLVTQEAVDKRFYEAGNATFQSPQSPQRLVEATEQLLTAK